MEERKEPETAVANISAGEDSSSNSVVGDLDSINSCGSSCAARSLSSPTSCLQQQQQQDQNDTIQTSSSDGDANPESEESTRVSDRLLREKQD